MKVQFTAAENRHIEEATVRARSYLTRVENVEGVYPFALYERRAGAVNTNTFQAISVRMTLEILRPRAVMMNDRDKQLKDRVLTSALVKLRHQLKGTLGETIERDTLVIPRAGVVTDHPKFSEVWRSFLNAERDYSPLFNLAHIRSVLHLLYRGAENGNAVPIYLPYFEELCREYKVLKDKKKKLEEERKKREREEKAAARKAAKIAEELAAEPGEEAPAAPKEFKLERCDRCQRPKVVGMRCVCN